MTKPKLYLKSPMLAAAVEVGEIRYPMIAQPKLDGIRCLVQGGKVLTRKFLDLPNEHVRTALSELGKTLLPDVLLDGELIVGTGFDFQATSSGLMSRDGKPDWTFLVFDCLRGKDDLKLAYGQRLQHAVAVVHAVAKTPWHKGWQHHAGQPLLEVIDHRVVHHEEQLLLYEATQLKLGYEGLCLRDELGHYKEGRSSVKQRGLLKLKRFVDAEAEVMGFEAFEENRNEAKRHKTGGVKRSSAKAGKVKVDKLGSLIVTDLRTKRTFSIGAGFTEGQRVMFWKERDQLLHKLVKYKSQPTGVKDKPRFPVFLGFRHEADT